MSQETLYFNGINGVEGWYGLEPMTSEDLSAHILGMPRPRPGDRQKLLKLGRDNTDKILRIVEVLAESNAQDVPRDAAWQANWTGTLARELAKLLLPDEYREPSRLQVLQDRLAQHTADKIVHIVELLAKGRAEELAELLLEDPDEAPDNQLVLRAKLGRDARIRFTAVQEGLRAAGQDPDLVGDATAQAAWLEALIRDLQVIPIDAINASERRRIRTLDPLLKELDALAGSRVPPSPGLDALRQKLREQPPDLSWSALLQILDDGLQSLVAGGGEQVPWPDLLGALGRWLSVVRRPFAIRGVIEGVDPKDLGQAGWGIIFPWEDPQADPKVPGIKEALKPLLDLRGSQAGEYFRVYEGGEGFRPGDTAGKFVARHGARVSDPADPKKVPYYLLIVGSPDEIPFHFQYQLDVQYAVGRIDFGDDLEAYARYANNVVVAEGGVAAETGNPVRDPTVALYGTSNPDDTATRLTADHLVQPLYERLNKRYGDGWQVQTVLRDEAVKARLVRLMGGDETPALLFAACHGMEFPQDDAQARQLPHQGALLCQDWHGPESEREEIPRDYYLAGEDLPDDANLQGLIAFFFACYSAGTPRYDEYTKQAFREERKTIAERPFVAALPTRMLSLPKGALAVVGHVERAWGTSYLGPRQSEQIAVFESAVERLLKGHPVGSAMEYFNGRYAAVSTELNSVLERAQWVEPDPYELAEMWTTNNDARGYIVIGDPAVRLPQAAGAGE